MSSTRVGNLQIGYAEAGNSRDSLPLIFLHGVGSDKSVWEYQLRALSEKRRVVAFDYPGYSESDLPENELSREEIARFILEAMDALEIDKANICGLSMGGIIALEMFARSPLRFASLVLADTFACHPKGEEIVARTFSMIEKMSMPDFAEQRVEALLMPQTGENIRREVVETMSRIPKPTFRWASKAVWLPDYLFLLPKINVPTLVIVGESDKVTPPDLSRELAENITNAKLEIIKNASHLSNLDQPEIFNELIGKFVTDSCPEEM